MCVCNTPKNVLLRSCPYTTISSRMWTKFYISLYLQILALCLLTLMNLINILN